MGAMICLCYKYTLPRASRSRTEEPERLRQDPEEDGVGGGCTSSGSGGISSENGNYRRERSNHDGVMNLPLHVVADSQRGLILM